jgi:hypothetical protein
VDAAAFTIAAILCAAFGGPLWATVTLAVLAFFVLAVKVAE